jgi:hypothetical protein
VNRTLTSSFGDPTRLSIPHYAVCFNINQPQYFVVLQSFLRLTQILTQKLYAQRKAFFIMHPWSYAFPKRCKLAVEAVTDFGDETVDFFFFLWDRVGYEISNEAGTRTRTKRITNKCS